MDRLCQAVSISRQAYYKGRKTRQRRWVDETAVIELVKGERCIQAKIGARKLLVLLKDELIGMGVKIGRDRFIELLRTNGLLIARKRRRCPQTTYSRHHFRTYSNLLKSLDLTGVHQAWVSDLTYVRTDEGFLYVSLISDAWSRKIVGYEGADTLEATGSLKALSMAKRQLPAGFCPIHHSDRGIQYACWDYVGSLESRGIEVSMTEENHCYENAQAERLNGILKQEYGLGETFRDKAQARLVLKQAVLLYNTQATSYQLELSDPITSSCGCGVKVAIIKYGCLLELQSPYGLHSVPANNQPRQEEIGRNSVNFFSGRDSHQAAQPVYQIFPPRIAGGRFGNATF